LHGQIQKLYSRTEVRLAVAELAFLHGRGRAETDGPEMSASERGMGGWAAVDYKVVGSAADSRCDGLRGCLMLSNFEAIA
jgi:hypothetical protein